MAHSGSEWIVEVCQPVSPWSSDLLHPFSVYYEHSRRSSKVLEVVLSKLPSTLMALIVAISVGY